MRAARVSSPKKRPRWTPPERWLDARRARDELRGYGRPGEFRGGTWIGPVHFMIEADGHRLHLRELWVSPEKRGKGQGRKFMRLLLRVAQAHRVKVMTWAHAFDRERANPQTGDLDRWYKSLGFEVQPNGWLLWTPRPE